MRQGLKHIICCGASAAIVLAGIAGCAANSTDSARNDTSDESATTTIEASTTPEDTEGKYDITQPSILESEGSIGDLNYELSTASADGGSAERGYYVYNNPSDPLPYIIFIESGERSSGGYDINITDIQYDGSKLNIIVQETAPGPDDVVTAALTYPCCAIKLSLLPDDLSVTDIAGNNFTELSVVLIETTIEDGWIACLSDGAGEIMKKTYVYETDDGKYKYINVESTTVSWGATQWNDVVKGSGTADTRDDIVKVAEEFGSCGFVQLPGFTGTVYTIDEFVEGKIFG